MSLIRTIVLRTTLAAGLFAVGCSSLRAASSVRPAPAGAEFAQTLEQAEAEVAAGRFGVADRLLADYAERRANTPEAAETALWRALFRLDPANLTAGPQDAIMLLDGYLHGPVTVLHSSAATALRRVAVALNNPVVSSALAADNPAGASAVRADVKAEPKSESKADEKAREEEITRLKEELSKANAELERIKRRLAQPNP